MRVTAGMFVRISTWDLDASDVTIADLRRYLRDESVDAFAKVRGLRLKLWIADDERNRWGAVYLFESREAFLAAQPLPSKAGQIIGYPPSSTEEFDVEASVEGEYAAAALSHLGRAFSE